jgi:CheY-like chemotaxis protein
MGFKGTYMRILVVDDNIEVTDVISDYCNSQKIECEIINDSKKTVSVIRDGLFDLIFLDLAMPELNGLDIIRLLADDGMLNKLNVVLFTASSDRKILDEISRSGVKEILMKPCSIEDLQSVVNRYRPH